MYLLKKFKLAASSLAVISLLVIVTASCDELKDKTKQKVEVNPKEITFNMDSSSFNNTKTTNETVVILDTLISVNVAEDGLLRDIKGTLLDLISSDRSYEHDRIDDNAAAHLRSMLLNSSVTVPVQDGELGLGTWQSILFVEADGPRKRHIQITVLE